MKARRIANKFDIFPIEEVPLLGQNDDPVKKSEEFIQEIEKNHKNDIKNAKPSQLFKIALKIYPRDVNLIFLTIALYALFKLGNSILINQLLTSITDFLEEDDSTSSEETTSSNKNIFKSLIPPFYYCYY